VERVRWEEYKGKKILFIDYSNLHATIPSEKEQILTCIKTAREATEAKKGKILFLSYVQSSSLDKDVMSSLKEFAAFTNQNGFVDKECVVGISSLQSMFVNTINLFSKAKLTIFDTVEKAKDWLVS
jgi:hypothetical protein